MLSSICLFWCGSKTLSQKQLSCIFLWKSSFYIIFLRIYSMESPTCKLLFNLEWLDIKIKNYGLYFCETCGVAQIAMKSAWCIYGTLECEKGSEKIHYRTLKVVVFEVLTIMANLIHHSLLLPVMTHSKSGNPVESRQLTVVRDVQGFKYEYLWIYSSSDILPYTDDNSAVNCHLSAINKIKIELKMWSRFLHGLFFFKSEVFKKRLIQTQIQNSRLVKKTWCGKPLPCTVWPDFSVSAFNTPVDLQWKL